MEGRLVSEEGEAEEKGEKKRDRSGKRERAHA